jgi:hypothetical protein
MALVCAWLRKGYEEAEPLHTANPAMTLWFHAERSLAPGG